MYFRLFLTLFLSLPLSPSLSLPPYPFLSLFSSILSFRSQSHTPNPPPPASLLSGCVITVLASIILPRLQPKPSARPSSPPTSSVPVLPPSSTTTAAAAASTDSSVRHLGVTPLFGALLIASWLAVLVGTIIAANATSYAGAEFLHWFQVKDREGVGEVERGR